MIRVKVDPPKPVDATLLAKQMGVPCHLELSNAVSGCADFVWLHTDWYDVALTCVPIIEAHVIPPMLDGSVSA